MKNTNDTTKRGNVLGGRLKKLIDARKQIHNPVVWLPEKDKSYSFLLSSNDEKTLHNTLIIQIGTFQLRFLFPKFIKPYRTVVYTRLKGFTRKGWEFDYASKVYGIGYLPKEKIFHIFYGVISGNNKRFPKDKLLIKILPWSKFKLTKHVIIDKNNLTFWENSFLKDPKRQKPFATEVLGGICPKLRFECINEDAYCVIGSAFVEEKEWSKGLNIPFLKRHVRTRRTLKIHLQINSLQLDGRPYSERIDFTMLNKETIREAVHRFCKTRVLDQDKGKRLYLEYIEQENN